MTDRELVFALLGLVCNDTNLLIGSLILLKRQVPFEVITDCQEEMARMVKNLHTLSEPHAKATIKNMFTELNKDD